MLLLPVATPTLEMSSLIVPLLVFLPLPVAVPLSLSVETMVKISPSNRCSNLSSKTTWEWVVSAKVCLSNKWWDNNSSLNNRCTVNSNKWLVLSKLPSNRAAASSVVVIMRAPSPSLLTAMVSNKLTLSKTKLKLINNKWWCSSSSNLTWWVRSLWETTKVSVESLRLTRMSRLPYLSVNPLVALPALPSDCLIL